MLLILRTVTIVNSVVNNLEGHRLVLHVVAKTQSIATQQLQLVCNLECAPARIAPAPTLVSRAIELIIQARINMIK